MKLPSYLIFDIKPRLPVVIQAESAECGLACLAMIAQYHGHEVDLNGLRQRFSFSLAGANLRQLMQVASKLSLATRALRVEMTALSRVQVPAILHWGGDHFVVLERIGKKNAIIHDPARGHRKVPLQELSIHFTGIVLEVSPTKDFEPVSIVSPIRLNHLWKNLRGLPAAITQIVGLSVLYQLLAFVVPLQLQLVIDESLANSDSDALLIICVAFFGVFLLHVAVEAARGWLVQLLGQQFVFQIISNLVNHLLRLPNEFFEKRHIGDILSRAQSTRVIQDVLTRGLVSALIDGVMAIFAAAVLIFYAPKLSIIVLVTFIIIGILNALTLPALRQCTEDQLAAAAKEQSLLMETIRAITTIKLLGGEPAREAIWRNAFVRSTNLSVQITKYQTAINAAQSLALWVQYTCIIYFGANMIINAEGFSVGMLVAFLSYRQTFSDRATSLLSQFNQYRLLRVHLGRLADITSQKADSHIQLMTTAQVAGEIEFKGVSFRYGTAEPFVLKELEFVFKRGEFVAIVGASGEGKSTLLKLLLGLYSPSEGHIFLDSKPASVEAWRHWRDHCGIVAQDDKLLSGTVADNIAFFDPAMDIHRVIEAAKNALIHDEIMSKPMQYQTLIGDMGAALSGGQRQRLLLARALYRSPRIIVLDEGTANLDEETEHGIVEFIANLPVTRIVVAHRPALVNRADRVFKLANGTLSEITNDIGNKA